MEYFRVTSRVYQQVSIESLVFGRYCVKQMYNRVQIRESSSHGAYDLCEAIYLVSFYSE